VVLSNIFLFDNEIYNILYKPKIDIMKLLQNILVPTDFSESSGKAIEASIQLAKRFKSRITLLYVSPYRNFMKETELLLEVAIKEKLMDLKLKISAEKVEVSDIIEKGVVFEKIIEVAQEIDANVIIVGSGSKNKHDNFKLGTTVEKLMRKNQIPLWVVKNEPVNSFRKILCPVDYSNASKRALTNAITLTKRFGAELTIIHIFEPIEVRSIGSSINSEEENNIRRDRKELEFNNFLDQFNFESIRYNTELKEGIPFLEILRAIKKKKSDLLIMGTTGKTGLSRLLMGSVTEKVTRELPCSFITTKNKDITDDYLESYIRGVESIINPAKLYLQNGNYQQAVEKFTVGLKQYPDNIPILMGLIESFKGLEDKQKVNFYIAYLKEILNRLWSKDNVEMLKSNFFSTE